MNDRWSNLVYNFVGRELELRFLLCLDILNHSFPMQPFSTPLKTSENLRVFWCFQGVEKGCIGNDWVKYKKRSHLFSAIFSYFSVEINMLKVIPAKPSTPTTNNRSLGISILDSQTLSSDAKNSKKFTVSTFFIWFVS